MRAKMRRWLWLLISFAGLAQAGPPPRIEVAYEMSQDGRVLADVVEVLELGGGRYQITETSKGRGMYSLLGSMKRTSRGLVDARGVRPLEFIDERPGWRDSRAVFDWQARTVTMHHKQAQRTEPMPADMQDRLSFMLSFALFPPKGASVTYNIADSKGLSVHVYRLAGQEKLRLPAGEFQTIKLVRSRENESAEVWLAKELGNFPVRVVVVYKDGKRLEQLAVRVSTANP
jgi:uncharacterized protein DUF3108